MLIEDVINVSHTLTAMYVEDDTCLHKEMTDTLGNFFASVLPAENGEEGLEVFESYKRETNKYPDIIITDINMPKLDGVSMSKMILERHPEQLIIVLSAYDETEYLRTCLNMGIEFYLIKPIQLTSLIETLHKASKKVFYEQMEVLHAKEQMALQQELKKTVKKLQSTMTDLEKQVNEDYLTGISNRRHFFEQAKYFFPKAQQQDTRYHVFATDIDKFKGLNDKYGHDLGDAVLKRFVHLVQNIFTSEYYFARFGGDEFVLVAPMSETEALDHLARLQERIKMPHKILGKTLSFDVSIGLTYIQATDQTIDTALKRADLLLYQKK